MSFCCGTDMLLTIAQLKQKTVTITNVPVLFCLICEKIIVHPDVEVEFELLKDYAAGDGAREVDLLPYVHPKTREVLYNPQNHADRLNMDHVLKEQLDRALDLYAIAQATNDPLWKEEILQRLQTLHMKKSKA